MICIMIICFKSVKHKLSQSVGFFELLGFDFMLDSDLNVSLNYQRLGLSGSTPRDRHVSRRVTQFSHWTNSGNWLGLLWRGVVPLAGRLRTVRSGCGENLLSPGESQWSFPGHSDEEDVGGGIEVLLHKRRGKLALAPAVVAPQSWNMTVCHPAISSPFQILHQIFDVLYSSMSTTLYLFCTRVRTPTVGNGVQPYP